jgi:hypothetical protein
VSARPTGVTVVETRSSPLVAQLALLVGFLLIAAASVVTVLIPELTDDGDEADGERPPAAAPAEPAAAPATP